MTCRDCQDAVLAREYGVLEAGEAEALAAHLAECDACRRAEAVTLAAWRAAVSMEPPPPPGLARAALDKVRASRKAASPRGWRRWAWRHWDAAAVALLAGVMLLAALSRHARLEADRQAAEARRDSEVCYRYLGSFLAAQYPGSRAVVVTAPGEPEVVEYLQVGSAGRLALARWVQAGPGWSEQADPGRGMTGDYILIYGRGAPYYFVHSVSKPTVAVGISPPLARNLIERGHLETAICPRSERLPPSSGESSLREDFLSRYMIIQPARQRPSTADGARTIEESRP